MIHYGDMTIERDETIRKLRKGGMSLIDIAKHFNITRQRVHQIVSKKYNPERRRRYKVEKLSTVA